MALTEHLKKMADNYTGQIHALYIAYRDPRMPRLAKVLTALVIAYALSPIDLIPDFIPVLGYLDDLILVPLGIMLAIRMIPPELLNESRQKAREQLASRPPRSTAGVCMVVGIWLLALVAAGVMVIKMT